MSVYSSNYTSKHDLLSPQRKPLAGNLLKTYSHRPTSALRTKYEQESSPTRNDSAKSSKKLPITRYSTTMSPTKMADPRTQGYRRRNDDSLLSNSLSKSTQKWDKHLNIETNGEPTNYSGLNLKGYSVTHNTSTTLLQKPAIPNSGLFTSKYSLHNPTSPLSGSFSGSLMGQNRGVTPPNRKVTPLTKDRSSSKGYSLNTSLPGPSSNERYFPTDPPKEDKSLNYTHTYSQSNQYNNNMSFEQEAAYLPPFEQTKCSIKQNGIIKAYGVNTHQGIVRNYNEDRVAIILNMIRPPHVSPSENWPLCSFFGVYDGHGGTNCADFLRDNLHQYVTQDKNFPKNPVEAIKRGFEEAERAFREIAQSSKHGLDKSGSCAIVALIIEDMCYIANVGDSRAVASFEQGKKAIALSRDHKPSDRDEQKRITSYGGKIYQSQITQPPGYPGPKVLLGPQRVFPGRLSVSRTFGDIEAKLPKYGGNPYVVIAEPEIKAFKITKEWDYIVLASDGIYDKMETEDVVSCIKTSTLTKESDIHKQTAVGVERLMKESLIKKTMDNITVVMVSFSGFEKQIFSSDTFEENRKPEIESTQKSTSFLNLYPGDRMVNSHYTPLGNKTFTSVGNERQLYSATGKRYDVLTNSADYGSYAKGPSWRLNS